MEFSSKPFFFVIEISQFFYKFIWHINGPKSFLFSAPLGQMATVNYDYIVTNGIISFLIGSRCILNGAIVEAIWPMLQNISTTLHCILNYSTVIQLGQFYNVYI